MKPILFNTDMVCAILNGQKTVSRRIIKPQPKHAHTIFGPSEEENGIFEFMCGCIRDGVFLDWIESVKMPYQPGDVLYVRETWALQMGIYWHKAGLVIDENGRDAHGTEVPQKWRPSIHMPKKAARIFLRVTDIRVERLQDIDEEDAKAEGANFRNGKNVGFEEKMRRTAIERFAEIWDGTVPKHPNKFKSYKYYWKDNPWVWVIEFERISRQEAERKATNENNFNY